MNLDLKRALLEIVRRMILPFDSLNTFRSSVSGVTPVERPMIPLALYISLYAIFTCRFGFIALYTFQLLKLANRHMLVMIRQFYLYLSSSLSTRMTPSPFSYDRSLFRPWSTRSIHFGGYGR